MKTLRQQYQDLDNQIIKEYKDLISKLETVTFFDEDEDNYDELTSCENITFIGRSGDNIDAYVLKIETEGIYIAEYEDESQRYWIRLNDLISLYSKITLVDLLETAQKDFL